MPLKIGTADVSKAYIGSSEVEKMYVGSVLVFGEDAPAVPAPPSFSVRYDDFSAHVTFTAQSGVTYFQWKYEGDSHWRNIIVPTLTGTIAAEFVGQTYQGRACNANGCSSIVSVVSTT